MNKYVNTDKKTGQKFVLTKEGKRFDVKQPTEYSKPPKPRKNKYA